MSTDFPDLLSAALSESGLDAFGDEASRASTIPVTNHPVQYISPVGTNSNNSIQQIDSATVPSLSSSSQADDASSSKPDGSNEVVGGDDDFLSALAELTETNAKVPVKMVPAPGASARPQILRHAAPAMAHPRAPSTPQPAMMPSSSVVQALTSPSPMSSTRLRLTSPVHTAIQQRADYRPRSPPMMVSRVGGRPVYIRMDQSMSVRGHAGGYPGFPPPASQPIRYGVDQAMMAQRSTAANYPANTLPSDLMEMGREAAQKQITDKDVSRMWSNDDIRLMSLRAQQQATFADDDDDEELGHAETYADYRPPKVKVGLRHPDPVVETSSLSSVEPPDVKYELRLPESIIDSGQLSALQLESVTYASQKHMHQLPSGERAGYLIGDGAGVGKGRTIAGIIYENYLEGRKRSVWLSVSNDLRVDAQRDLNDIGASRIEVHSLNKFKYAKISSKINNSVKKGVVFCTYSSLIGESSSGGKYRTRFKQLLKWLGKKFDGVIVFDECHRAKNLCPVGSARPTKTGQAVLDLQNRLPQARIVYASATGASEPKNMAYMTRLGLWGKGTPFTEFQDFISAVEKRGVGAMELVAMDMKLRGMYIARQLSFKGVSFNIVEVPISDRFVDIYNRSVTMWVKARHLFGEAAELMDADNRMKKTMWGQFWSAHQRFFKYLCISAKVRHCVKIAKEAVRLGKCVVIGLQSTGEARTLEQLEHNDGELTDFVSTARGVLQSVIEKHFPAPDRNKAFDWFGIGRGALDDSPQSSPRKRKRDVRVAPTSHLKKEDWSSSSGSEAGYSSSDSDDVKGSQEKDDDDLDESKDMSVINAEASDVSDESADDFNPFAQEGDSDEDVWLRKKKMKKSTSVTEKSKASKNHHAKKKKKSKKKSKSKKAVPQSNGLNSDSDDNFDIDEMDKKIDRTLQQLNIPMYKSDESTSMDSGISRGSLQNLSYEEKSAKAREMKQELLQELEKLGPSLPPNTLDHLIDELGGPQSVAEMTGRKGRVVSNDDGSVQYESRVEQDAPLETLNLTEKQRFMDGEKNVAIISEAASSGISLQADRRAVNQKRRVHITLELPWSADRAVQQFGRTHRSNQVSAPEYMFLISELAGERRFAATVAKRLESLGALTHGDRRATESRDLSRFNIDNKYGRAALEAVMKSVMNYDSPLVPAPEEYPGNFFQDVREGLVGVGLVNEDVPGHQVLDKDYNNMSKFLNRLLGLKVVLQNMLFYYFTEVLAEVIMQAKRNGRWDLGILDVGQGDESVKPVFTKTFVSQLSGCTVRTDLHTVSVERGMSWSEAMAKAKQAYGDNDGFYLSKEIQGQRRSITLCVATSSKRQEKTFSIYRPNTSLQSRREALTEVQRKSERVSDDVAREHWLAQYRDAEHMCSHIYWRGRCKKRQVGLPCETGLRRRQYHVLSGSVLAVWNKIEAVLMNLPGGQSSRMQLIRLRTSAGQRIVGSLIPNSALSPMVTMLSQESVREFETQHDSTYRPPYAASASGSGVQNFATSPAASVLQQQQRVQVTVNANRTTAIAHALSPQLAVNSSRTATIVQGMSPAQRVQVTNGGTLVQGISPARPRIQIQHGGGATVVQPRQLTVGGQRLHLNHNASPITLQQQGVAVKPVAATTLSPLATGVTRAPVRAPLFRTVPQGGAPGSVIRTTLRPKYNIVSASDHMKGQQ